MVRLKRVLVIECTMRPWIDLEQRKFLTNVWYEKVAEVWSVVEISKEVFPVAAGEAGASQWKSPDGGRG